MTDEQTGTGLPENLAGALSYVLGPVTGVAFLLLERENAFVRFHAAQSILLGVLAIGVSFVLAIVTTVLMFLPILGPVMALLTGWMFAGACFGLWLFLMWWAFQGEEWEFPFVGEQARKLVRQLSTVG